MKPLTLAVALFGSVALAQGDAGPLHNLKLLSDRNDDVTTVDNILKSFAKPGMSDEQRSRALWTAIVRYRHQTTPPDEMLAADWEAHDPVKIFNVYGYCMCCCCSALVEGLNRADGREARGRILNGHSVPEVQFAGGWHMYDASLITFFLKPDGSPAAVDEVTKSVRDWLAKNPDLRKNDKKLGDFMRRNGWTGWKEGPPLLTACKFLDNGGWFPARTHGWNATMVEYDRDCEVYEYGYQLGHKALFSLRAGESFTRHAGNRGLHVNKDRGPHPNLNSKAPAGDLVYLKEFLPGYNGAVIGNGVHSYEPAKSLLHVGAVIRMNSPWVYLGGKVRVRGNRKTEGDKMGLSLSTDNGRSWEPIWSADKVGSHEATVDLGDRVLRRYDFRLRVEAMGDGAIESMTVEADFQHAPRTLAWLAKGSNTVTLSTDGDPTIATQTVTGRITDNAKFAGNETAATMGVTFDNLTVNDGSCWWKGGVGTMTVPIVVPGDLVALRFGAQVRARGNKDTIKMLASFDAGKTWVEAARIVGPTPGVTRYFRFDKIPAGSRRALLKYEITGNNTAGIFNFRVDADWRDPPAAKAAAMEVEHRWMENGVERSHVEKVDRLPGSWKIATGAEPEMVSVTVRRK